jgi:L-alanine-DL-glutamate epimerase-like enolase superfamily enzyme
LSSSRPADDRGLSRKKALNLDRKRIKKLRTKADCEIDWVIAMKIANAKTILLSMPFEADGIPPWSFGGKPANAFDILLVRLETNDGLVGWGEAFSRGRDIALKQTIDTRLLPLILGRDALCHRPRTVDIDHDLRLTGAGFDGSADLINAIAKELQDLDLYWFEEPVWPPEARVRQQGLQRIAAGENAGSLHDFISMISAGAIDIAQPDVAKTGGLTEVLKIAALCEAHGVEFVPHCALFGPGQVATIHLSAAHRSTPIFERLFCDFEIELYGDATIPKNGKIKVPTGPGLGLEPVPEALEKFRLSV